MHHARHPPRPRAQRGIGLIEALLAFLVLSLGMLAMTRVQSGLRAHAELARQRTEAVRIAQQEIETLRSYSVLTTSAGARSYQQIASASGTVDSIGATRYELTRQVGALAEGQAASVAVSVRWNDRRGESQHTMLSSVIARSAPALAAALVTAPSGVPVVGAFDRSSRIPLVAKDLGNGRSAFKPANAGNVAIVQDNRSGQVVARCGGLAAMLTTAALTLADLTNCDTTIGLLLSGTVRFAQGAPLPLEIALALTSGSYPQAPQCTTTPIESGDRRAVYHCVVYPSAGGANAGRWSGQTTIVPVGWRIGVAPEDRRVCRFSSDLDGSGAIDRNVEHPAAYVGVDTALAQQNFLVVAGTDSCPTAPPVRIDGGGTDVYADLGTVQHQP
jgi:Tfp pilus assembly protein PilV